jgi:hypothetical protein
VTFRRTYALILPVGELADVMRGAEEEINFQERIRFRMDGRVILMIRF